jgi:hypothetical protein
VTSRQGRSRAGPLRVRAPRLRAGETGVIPISLPDLPGTAEAGSIVRATGPGFTVKDFTNEGGDAVVRVLPRRAGTIVVQSDRLIGSRRLRVLPRRSASARGLPRFTG